MDMKGGCSPQNASKVPNNISFVEEFFEKLTIN
jgi:hypothetical protein